MYFRRWLRREILSIIDRGSLPPESRNVSWNFMSSRLSTDLRRFLQPLKPGGAERSVRQHLRRRERMFAWLMRRAVYAQPRSPYRVLLEHTGISLSDLMQWVAKD